MAVTPVRAPRLNANDDEVKIVNITVGPSDRVSAEDTIAQLETDKAMVDVAAPTAGFVLRVDAQAGSSIAVGAPILWIGDTADEIVPGKPTTTLTEATGADASATAKARKLMAEYGLVVADFPAIGRIAERDVMLLVEQRGLRSTERSDAASAGTLPAAGTAHPLLSAQRAMMRAVSWHAAVPVPAYVEIAFDQAAWDRYARAFSDRHRLLFDPTLGLICHRLCQVAADFPSINGTIDGSSLVLYDSIKLGFTVRTKSHLVMVSVHDAGKLDELAFNKELSRLQRAALGERLTPEQTAGITIAFTSLQKSDALRHIPILPPQTSLIVAHSATDDHGKGVLGATYDHRHLDGDTVARVLKALTPPV